MESKLISVLTSDRAAYDQLKDHLDPDEFSDHSRAILQELVDYYDKDPTIPFADKDLLVSRLTRKYPNQAKTFRLLIEDLGVASVPNVLEEFLELRVQQLAQKLGTALASGRVSAETDQMMSDLRTLREEGVTGLGKQDKLYTLADYDDMFTQMDPGQLIPVYPKTLANMYRGGGIPRGGHVVVFARPEAGKSLFSISYAANLVKDGYRVTYAGNEDPAASMYSRMVSSILGVHIDEVLDNPSHFKDSAEELGLGNFNLLDAAPGSLNQLRRITEDTGADVVMVDQLRNLELPKNVGKVDGLEYLAQGVRNIAKELNVLGLSVTQAGDSADGRLHLSMGDVDYSNTGIPGAADVMWGIGVDAALADADQRVVNSCKNKFGGDHTPQKVSVIPSQSRVVDIA